jgi:hypothetical protein
VGEITAAERLRKQIEVASKFNPKDYLSSVCDTEESFKAHATKWLATVKCKPATKTLATSIFENRVYTMIGELPLSAVRNVEVKKVVDAIAAEGLSLSMMDAAVKFIRMVRLSVLNEDLEPKFPYQYNLKAIFRDVHRKQNKTNQPCPSSSEVTSMIQAASG